MWTCSECGAQNADRSRFCTKCGTKHSSDAVMAGAAAPMPAAAAEKARKTGEVNHAAEQIPAAPRSTGARRKKKNPMEKYMPAIILALLLFLLIPLGVLVTKLKSSRPDIRPTPPVVTAPAAHVTPSPAPTASPIPATAAPVQPTQAPAAPVPTPVPATPSPKPVQTTPVPSGGCTHYWSAASCIEPQTCLLCGLSRGRALGHDWLPATYSRPTTCSRCGLTSGAPLTQPQVNTPRPYVTPQPTAYVPPVITPQPVVTAAPTPYIPPVITPEPVVITPQPVVITPEPVVITPEPIAVPEPTPMIFPITPAPEPAASLNPSICVISESIRNAQPGDVISFGHYMQENLDEKTEEVRWRVLKRDGDRILVISEKVLTGKKYNETNSNATWETCTLRSWLNNDFLNECFSFEEQQRIPVSFVPGVGNDHYGTAPQNDTNDRVFILSLQEAANLYWGANDEEARQNRVGMPTAYARKNDAYVKDTVTRAAYWWVRNNGKDERHAQGVWENGRLDPGYGWSVDDKGVGVRPALWINVS